MSQLSYYTFAMVILERYCDGKEIPLLGKAIRVHRETTGKQREVIRNDI